MVITKNSWFLNIQKRLENSVFSQFQNNVKNLTRFSVTILTDDNLLGNLPLKCICFYKNLHLKCNSDTSYFILETNVGKSRIRHNDSENFILLSNDEFLDWLKIDWSSRHSDSDSFYVGSDSFRHWFQK